MLFKGQSKGPVHDLRTVIKRIRLIPEGGKQNKVHLAQPCAWQVLKVNGESSVLLAVVNVSPSTN